MSKKLLVTFALGAAAGAAIGYLLSSDENKEKVRSAAKKLTDSLKEEFNKGKEFFETMKETEGTVSGEPTKKTHENG